MVCCIAPGTSTPQRPSKEMAAAGHGDLLHPCPMPGPPKQGSAPPAAPLRVRTTSALLKGCRPAAPSGSTVTRRGLLTASAVQAARPNTVTALLGEQPGLSLGAPAVSRSPSASQEGQGLQKTGPPSFYWDPGGRAQMNTPTHAPSCHAPQFSDFREQGAHISFECISEIIMI
ncbi:hypothetical protein NDU88_005784 [Pleurodeles waltl]|uniref:Uncharacterized protein n=1 Tax=Pleurodeles waltl TaxID=8319 RepID=A0AAV7PJK5_PLEWA|nr:hypothetical protein NDU88_005784 [Pleurodeles waltl]